MPDPDDGTTRFQAGSLRELLDEGEKASAPKPSGPKVSKNVIIGGAVAAVILVIVLVAVLAGGGGGGGGSKAEAGRSPYAVEVRSGTLTPEMTSNARVSICGTDSAPLAENVRIVRRTTSKELAGLSTTSLSVSATPEEQAKLTPYRGSRIKELAVFLLDKCPAVSSTTVSSAPATTGPPASAPPASPPPASG